MVQIEKDDWNDIGEPEYIAVLPVYPGDLTAKKYLEFEEFEDEGLGIAKIAYVNIEETLYIFLAHPEGPPDCHYVSVRVSSIESDSEKALIKLIGELELTRAELVWEQEYLGPGKWLLTRLDDNGNEIEMFRFLNEISANRVKKKYENKGHKQAYFVKNVTTL